MVDLPFRGFSTSSLVGIGKVLCAPLSFVMSNISPEAVFLPLNGFPYQEACPEKLTALEFLMGLPLSAALGAAVSASACVEADGEEAQTRTAAINREIH
jgi:hypothetical protein